MRITLLGKHKNGEWQEIDHLELDSTESPAQHQHRKNHLRDEWKIAMGASWLWKWSDE